MIRTSAAWPSRPDKIRRGALSFLVLLLAGGCATMQHPAAVPSARAIAGIESGHALLDVIATVGVVDSASMNAASRVRVRGVACTPAGPNAATCSYEADRCLAGESDADGDGWCRRTARLRRVPPGEAALHEPLFYRGWTIERPRPADAAP